MGFCKNYTEFPLENTFNYAGIRFLPTMFPQIFDSDASQLSNRFENLNVIAPKISEFVAERFNETSKLDQISSSKNRLVLN